MKTNILHLFCLSDSNEYIECSMLNNETMMFSDATTVLDSPVKFIFLVFGTISSSLCSAFVKQV